MTIYSNMADIIDYLVDHYQDQPDLEALATKAGYDPTHFQKSFLRYVGVSPKQLIRYMACRRANDYLLQGYSTLDAAYEAGLSGNGRLHEGCLSLEAATPGEIKSRGKGVTISYGWHETPLGQIFIAETERGICQLSFVFQGKRERAFEEMTARWSNASFIEDETKTGESAEKIRNLWSGKDVSPIRLNLYGTNFQLQVWEALLRIPSGACVSYKAIAEHVCTKKASRAVGGAVGANPIAYLIPCHRVIQQSGIVENYAWGSERKKILLGLEGSEVQKNAA